MKFYLDTEKSPFCTVGPFSFTIGQEEHDIDVEKMPDEYRKQLLYNATRGVLKTDDKEGLAALAGAMQPTTPIPPVAAPIQYQQVAQRVNKVVKDPIQQDLKPLRALLRKTVATVKKEAASFPPNQLRKLMDLEEDGKNRKSVISFIQERLDQLQKEVAANIGVQDGDEDEYKMFEPMATDPNWSTQVSDIVESEQVQVTFGEEQLKKAAETTAEEGLLMEQDVLYQIDEE